MTGLVTILRRVPIRTLLHSRIMLSNFGICPNFRFLDGDGSSHEVFRNCWDIKQNCEYLHLSQCCVFARTHQVIHYRKFMLTNWATVTRPLLALLSGSFWVPCSCGPHH